MGLGEAEQRIGSELGNEKQFNGNMSECATYLTASVNGMPYKGGGLRCNSDRNLYISHWAV